MFSDFIFYSYIVAVCRDFSAGECYCLCGRWALLRRFWLFLCRILNGLCSYLYPIITSLVINILSVAWLVAILRIPPCFVVLVICGGYIIDIPTSHCPKVWSRSHLGWSNFIYEFASSCWALEVVMDDAFFLFSAGTPDSSMKQTSSVLLNQWLNSWLICVSGYGVKVGLGK
jgi:hypothetical protein